MANTGNWIIVGDDEMAAKLTGAARHVEAPADITISTMASGATSGAIATGSALLSPDAGPAISPLFGFRVLEEAARAVSDGEAGNVYGFFGSSRLERGASADDVRDLALVPLLAYALDIFPSDVERVTARRASLLTGNDAWFVTIRLADETLLTLEAMAVRPPGAGPQVLVEVTASEQVLRVEPTRQSVIVERTDAPAQDLPWWEDEAERLLAYIAACPPETRSGERLREVWAAVGQSLESGAAVEA